MDGSMPLTGALASYAGVQLTEQEQTLADALNRNLLAAYNNYTQPDSSTDEQPAIRERLVKVAKGDAYPRKSIKSLDLRGMPLLKDAILLQLVKHFPRLTSLSYNGESCLTSAGMAKALKVCKHLRELTIEGSLTRPAKEIASILKACPKLEVLNLPGWEDNTALNIKAKKLKVLDISMWHGLTHLELDCPELLSLDLTSCGSLGYQGEFLPKGGKLDIKCPKLERVTLGHNKYLTEAHKEGIKAQCPDVVFV